MLVEHRRNRALRNESDDAVDGLTVLEEDETRYSRHMVFARESWVPIRIELDETNSAGVRLGNFLDHRRQHLARTTPVGPEVYQYGLAAR
jgi:hypothetical protein